MFPPPCAGLAHSEAAAAYARLHLPSPVEEGVGGLCENLTQAVIPSEARNLALNVSSGRARFLVAYGSSE
jgi:hypothetical protein